MINNYSFATHAILQQIPTGDQCYANSNRSSMEDNGITR